MPYIPEVRRTAIDAGVEEILDSVGPAGELNYAITRLCYGYAKVQDSYSSYNLVMGVLACVAQEFYRRVVAPYEDAACKRNGDVYH